MPQELYRDCHWIVGKARGHVIQQEPVSGTPLHMLRALLPVLDSPGIETDLRVASLGSASYQAIFSHWQVVPGDPLDSRIKLAPLEASPAPMLARDCVLKTRRRKGLGEAVSINKFFDEAMREEMMEDGEGRDGVKLNKPVKKLPFHRFESVVLCLYFSLSANECQSPHLDSCSLQSPWQLVAYLNPLIHNAIQSFPPHPLPSIAFPFHIYLQGDPFISHP